MARKKPDALDELLARLDAYGSTRCKFCDDTGLDPDQDTYPDEPCPYCRPTQTPVREIAIGHVEGRYAPLPPAQRELASRFIAEEIRAGYPHKQAIAIGINRARRGR